MHLVPHLAEKSRDADLRSGADKGLKTVLSGKLGMRSPCFLSDTLQGKAPTRSLEVMGTFEVTIYESKITVFQTPYHQSNGV